MKQTSNMRAIINIAVWACVALPARSEAAECKPAALTGFSRPEPISGACEQQVASVCHPHYTYNNANYYVSSANLSTVSEALGSEIPADLSFPFTENITFIFSVDYVRNFLEVITDVGVEDADISAETNDVWRNIESQFIKEAILKLNTDGSVTNADISEAVNVLNNIESTLCVPNTLPDWTKLADIYKKAGLDLNIPALSPFLVNGNLINFALISEALKSALLLEDTSFEDTFLLTTSQATFHEFVYNFDFISFNVDFTWINSTKFDPNAEQSGKLVYIGSEDEASLLARNGGKGLKDLGIPEFSGSSFIQVSYACLAAMVVIFSI